MWYYNVLYKFRSYCHKYVSSYSHSSGIQCSFNCVHCCSVPLRSSDEFVEIAKEVAAEVGAKITVMQRDTLPAAFGGLWGYA
jgi:hypothetical protein